MKAPRGALAGVVLLSGALLWGSVATAAADAGVESPDAGTLPAYAEEFELQARQIRALLAGKLDIDVEPQSLFELRLSATETELDLERRRMELLLKRVLAGGPAALVPAGKELLGAYTERDAGSSAPEASARLDPRIWRARLDLDRARLAFYALPAARRAQLLQQHEEQRQKVAVIDHEQALAEASRAAQHAREQEVDALAAARRASTEAARLINEEYAHLLSVTREQAEYEKELIQRRADLDARNEAALAWRRRVNAITSDQNPDPASRERADATYVELRTVLRQTRQQLADALNSSHGERVPRAGKDSLGDLPADADRSVVVKQRAEVTSKALKLTAREQTLQVEVTGQLMGEVEALNRLRLELLPSLSAPKRASVLEFGPGGWDQAVSEVRQVVLTLRYHLSAAYDWLSAVRSGDARDRSAWLVLVLALKWAFPLGLFVWWRRRADALLASFAQREHAMAHPRRTGDWFERDQAEVLIAFARRVRRPLEWLLLVGSITWLLPPEIRSLLEVRVGSTVALWVFGGLFLVLAIDALAGDHQRGARPRSNAPEAASLRFRSLRLVGRAVVTFGLLLSLSELLVGRGTVYSWVFSTCWFAAIPLLLVIISWWRPFIFERFARMRKPNPFEAWVLSRRATPAHALASSVSSLAAVAGGLYLFTLGAVRVARNRVLTFQLTRRLLAYLFRRDLSKKARGATAAHSSLSSDAFRTLGPETSSGELVGSAADAQIDDVIRRIQAGRGGAIAIVGERGAGKSTLLERIVRSGPGVLSFACTAEGLPPLRTRFVEVLGLGPAATLDEAAVRVDCGQDARGLLIDDAQYLIRPMMGGLKDFDAFLPLVRKNSRNCTWILTFDEAIWHFVERTRGAQPLFDDVIRLSPWSEDAIVHLITERTRGAGLKPDFSDLAIDVPANADEVDLQEALRRTEASYYRLLWDYATGNPGVALHFWRQSLGVAPSGSVLVRLFEAPDATHFEALSDSTAFVLRAIIQLGWATLDEIARTTSLSREQVEDALRYGRQRGYFDRRGERYRISWDWFRAVTRFLHRRHLLFS